MENISFEDFKKLEIQIGKIEYVERVEKSDKLLKLTVDFGGEKRQIISGIAKDYSAEELENKSFVFIKNLEPRKIFGLESQGMILAADKDGQAILLTPEKDVLSGTPIR